MVQKAAPAKLPTLLILTALAALAALPSSVQAEELVLSFDPETTHVTFGLQATGHDVEGVLYLQNGEIRFDPATGTASGEIAVDATRADTGNKKRDKTMHNKVLESEEFPLMVFQAESLEGGFEPEGTSELQLHGTLSLHGQNHPVVLPVTIEAEAGHVKARSEFPVPYVEWGLKNPSFLFLRVADEVEVVVETEGTLSPAADTLAALGRANGE
jgi:polyisoprenoid-binding protein YceI